jgi:hypothetical protein
MQTPLSRLVKPSLTNPVTHTSKHPLVLLEMLLLLQLPSAGLLLTVPLLSLWLVLSPLLPL